VNKKIIMSIILASLLFTSKLISSCSQPPTSSETPDTSATEVPCFNKKETFTSPKRDVFVLFNTSQYYLEILNPNSKSNLSLIEGYLIKTIEQALEAKLNESRWSILLFGQYSCSLEPFTLGSPPITPVETLCTGLPALQEQQCLESWQKKATMLDYLCTKNNIQGAEEYIRAQLNKCEASTGRDFEETLDILARYLRKSNEADIYIVIFSDFLWKLPDKSSFYIPQEPRGKHVVYEVIPKDEKRFWDWADQWCKFFIQRGADRCEPIPNLSWLFK